MKKTTKTLTIVLSIVLCVALLSIGTFVYASESAKKNSIGLDAAIDVAMSDAGCAEENTIIQKARRTFEDGKFVYDIEFVSGGYEYDYLLKASDGTILEKDKDKEASLANTKISDDDTAVNTQTSEAAAPEAAAAEITLEEAKQIALKDAGVSEANVKITKSYKDYDDDRDDVTHYDIEFYDDSYEYEYEISLNGKIFKSEKEPFRKGNAGNNGSSNSGSTNSNSGSSNSGNSGSGNSGSSGNSSGITLEKAKEIALKDAGVSANNATFTKAKKDYDDDDATHYDIEFYTDSYKYEYDISLKGNILSIDKDPRRANNSGSSNNTGSSSSSQQTPEDTKYIGIDKAKSIALNHAGFSASDVRFTKAKLEKDDGRVMYEIEFNKDYFEYEYDIDAKTGKILSAEKDD